MKQDLVCLVLLRRRLGKEITRLHMVLGTDNFLGNRSAGALAVDEFENVDIVLLNDLAGC